MSHRLALAAAVHANSFGDQAEHQVLFFWADLDLELDQLQMRSRLFEQWAKKDFNKQIDSARVGSHFAAAAEAFESLSVRLMRTPQ